MFEEKMNPRQEKISISPEDGQELKCKSCECVYFTPVVKLLKFSKILTGAPKDTIMQVPAVRCSDCGEILEIEE